MLVSKIATFALFGFAAAAPYYPFPLDDNFPNPSPSQLKSIQVKAGGSLPGGALPKKLSAGSTVTLQLIALNELFEVAYFNKVLEGLKKGGPGWDIPDKDYALKTITAIRNQEELHALGVNAALATAGQTTIAPCKYLLPDLTYEQSIALANTFTDVVLGVLPMAQTAFAADPNTVPFINLFGSVIAQEAEQNGWYRSVQKKIASSAPFKTTEGPTFAFTFLTSVIAPGCPGVDLVKKSVPTYKPLTVAPAPYPQPTNKDLNIFFEIEGTITYPQEAEYSVVYITGANVPVAVKIFGVDTKYGKTTFGAKFPFAQFGFAKGLTIAALVKAPSTKKYTSPADVAAVTVYGPGIIEVM